MKEIRYNNGIDGAFETAYSYSYDGNGNLSKMVDHIRCEATVYGYDVAGNLTDSYVYDTINDEALTSNRYVYDEQQRLTNAFTRYQYSASSYMSRHFAYNTDSTLKYVSYGSAIPGKITPTYDALGRVTQRVTDFATIGSFYQTAQYTYQKSANGDWDTPYVSEYTVSIGNSASDTAPDTATYRYTYDDVGNITHIHDGNNTLLYRYTYDALGQLTREDNAPLGKTYLYTYDNAGNRLFKRTYAFTTGTPSAREDMIRYTYGDAQWGDLLTSYGDWNVEYDEIGNPTFLYIQVDETWQNGYSLIWDGRNLIGIQQSERINGEMGAVGEGTEIEYNADGIRVYMYTPSATHYYTVDGSTILEEKIVDSYGVHYLVYVYDETGAPIAIKYSDDNTTFSYYFFEKNLQGDIVGIYNESGNKIGSYVYDAWGNVTASATAGNSSTDTWIVNSNPFRYRGYYYDTELGWYYLQTRYYNPEIGRFLNADGYVSTGQGLLSYNMFAYCQNNPILGVDPCGSCFHHWRFWEPCERCADKSLGERLEIIYEDFVKLVKHACDAITVDIGIGAGVGVSGEIMEVDATLLARKDYITLRKEAGGDFLVGTAEEIYSDISVMGTSFPKGTKKFYDFSGAEIYSESLEPHYDFEISIGGSIYFGFGITFSVGIDIGYLFNLY